MKQIVNLAVIFMIICAGFSSCSKDDDIVGEGGTGNSNGHEFVDLGLPSGIYWATCNVGSKTPEDGGNYFAWGEVSSKNTFEWSNYKYYKSDDNDSGMTKYCGRLGYNDFTDGKTTLEPGDDAASINWKGNWRTPTIEEWVELRKNCTWNWIDSNGAKGYQITGPNGRMIFLPVVEKYNSDFDYYSYSSEYWSSTVSSANPNTALMLFIDSEYIDFDDAYRYLGLFIRPVYSK